ncbi:hypothetical protein QP248_02755 [Aerococcus sp. UMB8608]|uniref:hypothetical protein n=1 Tax=Aerococcus sp. UMB8608 TaxID=3046347 RepID=UPI00254C3E6E|nr:hypothetical protein [Aerococcus sp. UMB8608]MDK6679370.1 hypothetical protein [Aerococcus sp. UMB8608]
MSKIFDGESWRHHFTSRDEALRYCKKFGGLAICRVDEFGKGLLISELDTFGHNLGPLPSVGLELMPAVCTFKAKVSAYA